MSELKMSFKNQNVIIEDRNRISITGVEQVDSFNENTIILLTIKGGITIKGEDLNISKLNLDEGNVRITGLINSFTYNNKELVSKNLISKIFK